MAAITGFFDWLFNTRQGVLALIVGGIVIVMIIAFILERGTRKQYFNHKKSADDWDLFDDESDSESGWSEFDDDNK